MDDSKWPEDHDYSAVAVFKRTGEAYGVGSPGVTTSAVLILEGNANGVRARSAECWTALEFDLPVLLALGAEPWPIDAGDVRLVVRLLEKRRGEELWSTLDTTALPRFTRVAIKSVPAFDPDHLHEITEMVLANIDLLLAAAGQGPLKQEHRERLSLRAEFYRRPYRHDPPLLKAIVPLTGVIEQHTADRIPLTPAVLDRLAQLREEVVDFVATDEDDELFISRLGRAVHDFGFFCRQHPQVLGLLQEELLRDLLLVAVKQLFSAEGEAFHHRGKCDIKVVSPHNRYEFAVVELKIWRGEASIAELLKQITTDHVTGQESGIIAQVFSRNKDFAAVANQVRALFEAHENVSGPLEVVVFPGSQERMYSGHIAVRDRSIPLLLSCVDLHSGP